jgi:hypothetical protein
MERNPVSEKSENIRQLDLFHYAASRKVAGSSPDEVDFLN